MHGLAAAIVARPVRCRCWSR